MMNYTRLIKIANVENVSVKQILEQPFEWASQDLYGRNYRGYVLNDQVIGFIAWDDITEDNKRYLYITNIEVLPEYRKNGIGTTMLKWFSDNVIHGDDVILGTSVHTNLSKNLFEMAVQKGILPVNTEIFDNT